MTRTAAPVAPVAMSDPRRGARRLHPLKVCVSGVYLRALLLKGPGGAAARKPGSVPLAMRMLQRKCAACADDDVRV